MKLNEVREKIFKEAFKLLPIGLNTNQAQIWLLTIGLQESRFEHRAQLGGGPARGFWQFEEGNKVSRAGVYGTMHHRASGMHVERLCKHFGIPFEPKAIWKALETNDVLACCMARLLLLTDAYKLPVTAEQGWEMYAKRVWRPGKPHRETWDAFHAQAVKEVLG